MLGDFSEDDIQILPKRVNKQNPTFTYIMNVRGNPVTNKILRSRNKQWPNAWENSGLETTMMIDRERKRP